MTLTDAVLLLYSAAHIAAHFSLFLVWFRHSASATNERAILLFHVRSAVLLTAAAGIVVASRPGEGSLAAALASVFAHGIYSLTFLELWTLAQISYSRDVLHRVVETGLDEKAIGELAAVGESKRTSRLQALSKAGFLEHENGIWKLTLKGRAAAWSFSALLWLPAVRSPG